MNTLPQDRNTMNATITTKYISTHYGTRSEYVARAELGTWWKEKSFRDYSAAVEWCEWRARDQLAVLQLSFA